MRTDMRTSFVILSLLVASAVGCIHRPPVLYSHPQKPPAAFEADKYECEVKARQILAAKYPGSTLAAALELNKEIARCLEAHGWVRQP